MARISSLKSSRAKRRACPGSLGRSLWVAGDGASARRSTVATIGLADTTNYSIYAMTPRGFGLSLFIQTGRVGESEACFSRPAKKLRKTAGFTRLEMGATLAGVPFYRAKGYIASEPLE